MFSEHLFKKERRSLPSSLSGVTRMPSKLERKLWRGLLCNSKTGKLWDIFRTRILTIPLLIKLFRCTSSPKSILSGWRTQPTSVTTPMSRDSSHLMRFRRCIRRCPKSHSKYIWIKEIQTKWNQSWIWSKMRLFSSRKSTMTTIMTMTLKKALTQVSQSNSLLPRLIDSTITEFLETSTMRKSPSDSAALLRVSLISTRLKVPKHPSSSPGSLSKRASTTMWPEMCAVSKWGQAQTASTT